MPLDTTMLDDHASRRIIAALDNRGVVLVLADDDARRREFLREMCDSPAVTHEHAPVIIRTPEAGTDTALLRALTSALGLRQTRTRMPMWSELTRRAEACYDEGRRLLFVVDDLHLAGARQFAVLHSLTTITVGHDLAIGIVLAGRDLLRVRLGEERHHGLRSRIGAVLRPGEVSSRAA